MPETTFYFNPFALISFSSFLVMTILAIILMRRYDSATIRFVVLQFFANAIYSFFYTFEISFKTLSEIALFYRFEYFGISFLSTFYLMFALHFSGRERWLTKTNSLLLFSIPFITLALIFSNSYHHLFHTSEKLNLSGPFPTLSFTPAIWYYVFQVYVIVNMLLSLLILGKMLKSAAAFYSRQIQYLMLATLFPFLGYLIYLLRLVPFGIDPVAFTFTLSGIFLYMGLVRFRLFELLPVARSSLFEKIQDCILVFDLHNRLVDYNQAASQALNLTRKELGKTTRELINLWPEMLQFVENNQKGGARLRRALEGITTFHTIQLLELGNAFRENQGKLVIIRDISELINTELERNYTVTKLDAIVSALPDMMFVINRQGILTDFFASDAEQLFLNKEEVLGASLFQLFTHEEANTLMEMLNNCLQSSGLNTYQYEMSFPDVLKHYEARISRMDDNQVLAIIRDVSESHEMKQSLLYQSGFQKILMKLASRFIHTAEEETDQVIDDALKQVGEFIGADRCYVVRYNDNCETTNNFHEWCREGISSLIGERIGASGELTAVWSAAHQKGEITIVEDLKQLAPSDPVRLALEKQHIQSFITFPMISQKNCRGYVGLDIVLGKRKWLDEEISLLKIFTGMLANLQEKFTIEQSLAEARIKAEAGNRLKTAFMNNISHEIRTPLNGIIGFGEIIANEQLSMEEKNRFLTVVQGSSERLIQTIDDYLDISLLVTGNQEVNPTRFNLPRFIEEVVEEFEAPCREKNLTIASEIPEQLAQFFMFSDPDLIRKIFFHLVSNAIKFTEKGSIRIGLTVTDRLDIFIQDTGIGIAKDAQQYIFDSFMQEDFSSTRRYEGSGLGLSIVKEIVTLLGGEITLHSDKGKGSTFKLSFPLPSQPIKTANKN